MSAIRLSFTVAVLRSDFFGDLRCSTTSRNKCSMSAMLSIAPAAFHWSYSRLAPGWLDGALTTSHRLRKT
jgi:hypothetical protein